MKNRIITISREFEAEDAQLKNRRNRLGIPCYDRELLHKCAESGFDENYTSRMPGNMRRGFLVSVFRHHSSGPNNADYPWEIQYRISTELAPKGPCVIVGVAVGLYLRDKADLLRVFVHADMKFRAERIVKEHENGSPAATPARQG